MPDDALTAWVNSGAEVAISDGERQARTRAAFARRFVEALKPDGDLGPTEEEHELAVARRVFDISKELSVFGIDEYGEVWRLLDAPIRRAIKTYIGMVKT